MGPEAGEAKRRRRRRLRAVWAGLEPGDLRRRADRALSRLRRLEEWGRAGVIFCYVSLPGEFPTRALIEAAWREGKVVAAPVTLSGHVMEARRLSSWDALITGRFGIPEPDPTRAPRLEPSALDLAVVPALAFDRSCRRLGRGGGYYDRYLRRLPDHVPRLGWMAAPFLVSDLPVQPHDARVHAVVTDEGVHRCPGHTAH